MERFEFESGGETIVGDLHLPSGSGRFPAVVLLGPLTSVKEQATGSYAQALSRKGYAALSFDPAHFGESSGTPRSFEDPSLKAKNAKDGASHLSHHHSIDEARVFAVGVCAGAGYMAAALTDPTPFRAYAAVAGFFHDAAKQKEWMGQEKLDAALTRAKSAREKFESSGEVETIPAVGREGEVAMPLAEAYEYYGTSRGGSLGRYNNEFAVMSREKTLPYDAQGLAAHIHLPALMIHSENALAPALARSFYEHLGSREKKLIFVDSVGQIDFYDDSQRIEPAVEEIVSWFNGV
jgi:hypothetical protein